MALDSEISTTLTVSLTENGCDSKANLRPTFLDAPEGQRRRSVFILRGTKHCQDDHRHCAASMNEDNSRPQFYCPASYACLHMHDNAQFEARSGSLRGKVARGSVGKQELGSSVER